MPSGLQRFAQSDFSGGMHRSGEPEAIPANAAYDITNGLLDRVGAVYKRGGVALRASGAGDAIQLVWDGYLTTGGQTTLGATATKVVKQSGTSIVDVGTGGVTGPGRVASYEGVAYFPGGKTYDGATFSEVPSFGKAAPYYAVVANRILAANGTRIHFSKIGKPTEWVEADFHELPGGVQITGIEGLRSSAAVFTTRGLWIIGGLNKNLVDATGNVQQTLDLYSADFVLWGSGGIAAWEGALVVPATDGVYEISLGVSSEKATPFVRISDAITDLYRFYVRQGYTVGQACVHENHYLLPIVNGNQLIDLLVCRLDMPGRPWTRLTGMGAMGALFSRTAGGARTPELLGGERRATQRALYNLSYFKPGAGTALDAGAVPTFSLTTRSYPTGQLNPNLVHRLRMRYLLSPGPGVPRRPPVSGPPKPEPPAPSEPRIMAEVGVEAPVIATSAVWGAFSWGDGTTWAAPLSERFEPVAGAAPPSEDGGLPFTWRPRRKRRFVRFRLSCGEPTSQLSLRSLEVFVRPDGRL